MSGSLFCSEFRNTREVCMVEKDRDVGENNFGMGEREREHERGRERERGGDEKDEVQNKACYYS